MREEDTVCIGSAFNAQSDLGVVFNFFSASQQSMRSI